MDQGRYVNMREAAAFEKGRVLADGRLEERMGQWTRHRAISRVVVY